MPTLRATTLGLVALAAAPVVAAAAAPPGIKVYEIAPAGTATFYPIGISGGGKVAGSLTSPGSNPGIATWLDGKLTAVDGPGVLSLGVVSIADDGRLLVRARYTASGDPGYAVALPGGGWKRIPPFNDAAPYQGYYVRLLDGGVAVGVADRIRQNGEPPRNRVVVSTNGEKPVSRLTNDDERSESSVLVGRHGTIEVQATTAAPSLSAYRYVSPLGNAQALPTGWSWTSGVTSDGGVLGTKQGASTMWVARAGAAAPGLLEPAPPIVYGAPIVTEYGATWPFRKGAQNIQTALLGRGTRLVDLRYWLPDHAPFNDPTFNFSVLDMNDRGDMVLAGALQGTTDTRTLVFIIGRHTMTGSIGGLGARGRALAATLKLEAKAADGSVSVARVAASGAFRLTLPPASYTLRLTGGRTACVVVGARCTPGGPVRIAGANVRVSMLADHARATTRIELAAGAHVRVVRSVARVPVRCIGTKTCTGLLTAKAGRTTVATTAFAIKSGKAGPIPLRVGTRRGAVTVTATGGGVRSLRLV